MSTVTFMGQVDITTTNSLAEYGERGVAPSLQSFTLRLRHDTNAATVFFMIIPQSALSSEALLGVIKEFVTREGTEYGAVDISLEAKVRQVQRQIDRGDVVIVFDEGTESVDLVSKGSQRYKNLLAQSAE